jgi:hypothetical protein
MLIILFFLSYGTQHDETTVRILQEEPEGGKSGRGKRVFIKQDHGNVCEQDGPASSEEDILPVVTADAMQLRD